MSQTARLLLTLAWLAAASTSPAQALGPRAARGRAGTGAPRPTVLNVRLPAAPQARGLSPAPAETPADRARSAIPGALPSRRAEALDASAPTGRSMPLARRLRKAFMSARLAAALLGAGSPALAQEQPAPPANNRIFWIIPNHRTEEMPGPYKPLSVRGKLDLALRDTLDPPGFLADGFYAGTAHLQNDYPSWGRGPRGLRNRYAAAVADQTISLLLTEGVFPALLGEDPRYFRLGRGGPAKRTGYALSHAFTTRKDSGRMGVNWSGILGNAAMAAASNAYIPAADRTLDNTAMKFGFQLAMSAVSCVFEEWWPDMKRGLSRRPAARGSRPR